MDEEYKVQGLETCDDAIKMAHLGKQTILDQGFINISVTNNNDHVRISIEPPEGENRVSHDIVCVLDISASMKSEASVKNKDGNKESQGLTCLDVLKHATKTVIHNLTEKDRFSLVSFSDYSRLEFALQTMTKENIILAQNAVEDLHTEGCTNIWDGIELSLEQLRQNQVIGVHQSLIVLTDGEPNVCPPKGYVQALQQYKDQHPDFYFSLNTFAFGKKIDTKLLDQYAMMGNGQYNFIPCPGFIGTIFVNSLANILNTMGSQCKLSFEMLNGTKIIDIPGGVIRDYNTINIGDIKFGQPRDIVLKVKFPTGDQQKDSPYISVKVEYFDYVNRVKRIGEAKENIRFDWDDPMVEVPLCRAKFSDVVKTAVQLNHSKKQQDAVNQIKNLDLFIQSKIEKLEKRAQEITGNQEKLFEHGRNVYTRNFLTGLKKDVTGEVLMAISQKHSFEHWGQHFLPSLCHCHMKQQCNNFCDPGIQGYGGQMFKDLKDVAEMTFLKLPPPKPSKQQKQKNKNPQQLQQNQNKNTNKTKAKPQPQQHQVNSQQQQQQVKPEPKQRTPSPEVDIAQYYNCGGGCFLPNCLVKLSNGQQKLISEINSNDLLYPNSRIKQIVQIENSLKKSLICTFQDGLKITHNHPVLYEGIWQKPCKIVEPKLEQCDIVYNFVLENGNSVFVNGIECVTFGHEIEDAFHPYFSSKKIVEDLKKFTQSNGVVKISTGWFKRDEINQQVIGIEN